VTSGSVRSIEAFERAYAQAVARKRAAQAAVLALGAACVALAVIATEFSVWRIVEGWPRTSGFFEQAMPNLEAGKLLADVRTEGSLAFWYYRIDVWLVMLLESAEMAVLATALGASAALLLAFLSAGNTSPHPVAAFAVTRLLEFLRTLPDLVIALIFVFAFGIGPMAGVLAIALHTTGALGKLMAEVIENIDMKPLEGLRAAGAGWSQTMRFGALPQILPNFASYAMLRFEINVAAAAAIGLVGAGGIGQEFIQAINFGYFRDASAILLLIIGMIVAIDLVSQRIRHRLIGAEAMR